MKPLRLLLCAILAPALALFGQDTPAPPAPVVTDVEANPEATFSDEQLDQLLGPIALYPDALIALILPAATQPADIVLAARYLKERGDDLSQVESRAWDESVKSLTHYPDVLTWLDQNLTWTKQVGEAFAEQPAAVMSAVQRLRARAQSAGTLATTPQQQVIAESSVIRIVPAEPDIIYVPRYDPAVVFVSQPSYYYYPRSVLTFGPACRVGSWLAYDFDWHRSTLWIGDRHRHWSPRHDWRRPLVPVAGVSRPRPYDPHFHHRYDAPPRPWRPAVRPHSPIQVTRSQRVVRPQVPTQTPPKIDSPALPGRRPTGIGGGTRGGPFTPGNRVTLPVRTPNVVPITPAVPGAPTFAPRGNRTQTSPTRNSVGHLRSRSSPTTGTLSSSPAAPTVSRPHVAGNQRPHPGFASRGGSRPAPPAVTGTPAVRSTPPTVGGESNARSSSSRSQSTATAPRHRQSRN